MSGEIKINIVEKRFGERLDIREFVLHGKHSYMVQHLAEEFRSIGDPVDLCWELLRWNAENIRYPWDSSLPEVLLFIADLHLLFRHPVPRYWRLSINVFDFFKFPWETLRDRVGDCEDKAILGTSVLRVLGQRAFVVLGAVKLDRYYGHAWTEVQIGNESYVLEWTLDKKTLEKIGKERYFRWARTENLYERVYFPMVKFDEEEIHYVRTLEKLRKLRKRVKKLRELVCLEATST